MCVGVKVKQVTSLSTEKAAIESVARMSNYGNARSVHGHCRNPDDDFRGGRVDKLKP